MSRLDQDIKHYLCMTFQRQFKKYQLVCIKKKSQLPKIKKINMKSNRIDQTSVGKKRNKNDTPPMKKKDVLNLNHHLRKQ